MVFTYGFLEGEVEDARQLLLDLDIPDDDPLKPAKRMVCDDAPGVRVYSVPETSKVDWDSGFVWWACVNEEDGLEFRVLQSNDGERELKVYWKEKELSSSEQLLKALKEDPMWDVFQLRATMIVQERVDTQLSVLQESQIAIQEWEADKVIDEQKIRRTTWYTIMKLRELEGDLLIRAMQSLEAKVCHSLCCCSQASLDHPFPKLDSSSVSGCFMEDPDPVANDHSRKPSCWSLRQ